MRRRELYEGRQPRFSNIYGTDDYLPKFYLDMFQEDAAGGVVPLRFQESGYTDFAMTVSGPEPRRAQALDLLASISGEDWYHESEIVSSAIEHISRLLVWEGKIYFEILPAKNELGPILHNFSRRGVFKLPFGFLQRTPRGEASSRRWTWLGTSDVWTVSLPEQQGTPRSHRRMLRRLGALKETGPDFFRLDLENRRLSPEYDSKMYHRTVKIAVFRATRKWGWIARDWHDEDTTEYYRFDRTLTDHWAKASLREHIVSGINSLLLRVLPGCSISVTGLPSPSDIHAVQQRMRLGEIDFKTAMQAVKPEPA